MFNPRPVRIFCVALWSTAAPPFGTQQGLQYARQSAKLLDSLGMTERARGGPRQHGRGLPPPLSFSDCRLPGNRKHRSKADFSLFRQHSPVLKVLAEGNSSNLNTGTMSKNHEGIYSCQIWLLKKRKKNAPRNISGLVGLYSILVLRSFRVLQNVLKRLHAV